MVILYAFSIVVIALLPALIWLTLFLREDEHPEPPKLLIKIFMLGMLASVPALTFQLLIQKIVSDTTITFASTMFLFAASEELFKFFGAYSVAHKNPDFDEPVDAMIYMIVAGLGFASVENLFVVGSLVGSFNGGGIVEMGQALFLRLVGATLLHTLASALIGYYWAKGVMKKEEARFIIVGLFVAFIVHGLFNYFVREFEDVNVLIPTLFLVGASFFVFSDFEKLKNNAL